MAIDDPTPSAHRGRLQLQAKEERAEELLRFEREIEREARWSMLWTILGCLAFSAIGALLMAYAVSTTDQLRGSIAFSLGLLIGYGGIALTLAEAYRRSLER